MDTNAKIEKLGVSITKAASLQTYYTVRFLADHDRVADAYQAYAYFRWVDDWLDAPGREASERLRFVRRQQALIEACYERRTVETEATEERMLVHLITQDGEESSGLQAYIRNLMNVMAFDAERRGRLISAEELGGYSRALSVAVMEALHYFIGHGSFSPHNASRYLAVEAAHITHMLRDTLKDNELGYFNIPRETVKRNGISPLDVGSEPYRAWVRSRVQLARCYFGEGRNYLSQVESRRCRLACLAYVARFESVLDCIERDGYVLLREYRRTPIRMGWSALSLAFSAHAADQTRSLNPRRTLETK